MKHLTKYIFTILIAFFVAVISINAQHQMNHSQNDTTKQMHHMMNDSTKMHHMESDSTKMMHNNMNHNMGKDIGKQDYSEKEIWNSHCPIREGEIDPKTPTVEYKGKTIGFCCPGCDSKFMDNPEKYMKKFDENGNIIKEQG